MTVSLTTTKGDTGGKPNARASTERSRSQLPSGKKTKLVRALRSVWKGTQSLLDNLLVIHKGRGQRSVFNAHRSHREILTLLLRRCSLRFRRTYPGQLENTLTKTLLNGDRLYHMWRSCGLCCFRRKAVPEPTTIVARFLPRLTLCCDLQNFPDIFSDLSEANTLLLDGSIVVKVKPLL